MVKIHTLHGDIVLQLSSDKAPVTVENFLDYCRMGFYHQTIFHRIIKDFMIQGGGFAPGMREKKACKTIINEADNGLLNQRGTIAMARTADPHSASAQFFINVRDNPFLNFRAKTPDGWGYCVFGRVVEGMNVVDQIRSVITGDHGGLYQDVPQKEVIITHVTLPKEEA